MQGETMDSKPIIYVDADACPVKDEVVKVAERLDLVVTFVSNGGMRPSRDPMIRNVVVSKSADAADDWIVDNAKTNDIVVTADIPLAARAVALARTCWDRPGAPSRRKASAWRLPCATSSSICARPVRARATMPPLRRRTARVSSGHLTRWRDER